MTNEKHLRDDQGKSHRQCLRQMRNWPPARSLADRAILGSCPKWISVFRIYWVLHMGSHSIQSIHLSLCVNRTAEVHCNLQSHSAMQWYLTFTRHENTSLKTKQGFYGCVNLVLEGDIWNKRYNWLWLRHAYMITLSFVNGQNTI